MIITNKLALPAPFVSLAQQDYIFEPGVYRVTSLLKGVRETILERRHNSEITRDVSDMVWLLFGTAVHGILENQTETDTQIKENRLKAAVGDYAVSGQFDLYDDATKTVTDYKTASVWKIIFGNFEDWRRQLLVYCWLLRQIGFDPRHGEIIAFLKDHSKRDAKLKPEYPQFPVAPVRFDFTDEDFAECGEWLKNRFAEIQAAEQLPDDELPLCTPEERFNSGDKYAVMKGTNKKALRVLDTLAEADAWMAANGGDHIDIRPGEDKKCGDYCAVCEFCDHYLKRKAEENV